MRDTESKPTVKLALSWTLVGVPLLLGVIDTLRKSLALFGRLTPPGRRWWPSPVSCRDRAAAGDHAPGLPRCAEG